MVPKMRSSDEVKSGLALMLGASQFTVLLILNEVLYSTSASTGYSVSVNYISDLGASCSGSGACYFPPSALLFDASLVLFGLFTLVAAYYIQRAYSNIIFTALLSLFGFGVLGVGIFPENTGDLHSNLAAVAFLVIGPAAIAASRSLKRPMSTLSLIMGALITGLIILFGPYWSIPGLANPFLSLGGGGLERPATYPGVFWAIGVGGYLMSRAGTWSGKSAERSEAQEPTSGGTVARVAGAILFIGAVQFGVLLAVSEVLYTNASAYGYSVAHAYIGDLGSFGASIAVFDGALGTMGGSPQ